jgi:hydroxyacyl-ACP dehydratase HTD2-like protein with hotdog domain
VSRVLSVGDTFERSIEPDEIDLFLYSSAIAAVHRIHYDRQFALSEAQEDLVVQGPLQAALIMKLIQREVIRGTGRLTSIRYRNLRPAFVNRRLEYGVRVTSLDYNTDPSMVVCDIWTRSPDANDVCLSGSATVSGNN